MTSTKQRAKKRWSDLSRPAKVGVVLGGLLEVLATTFALRDLRSRENSEVRGPKWLWFAICLIQPVGPLVYLLAGRRR